MFLLFTFSDGTTITSDFIQESSKITNCFYNELKYADDSASLKIPFNETLCDKIKTEISKNIKVQIKEDGGNLFTGYARKTINFSKKQRNQPFSLEIVSPALLFDCNYSGTFLHYTNTTLSNIVINLLSLTDYSGDIDVTNIASKQIMLFTLHDGDNVKDVLNELLFEYGYTYSFDGNGDVYFQNIFQSAPTTINQKLNGDNCLNEIQQQVKEDKYNRVSVEWNKVEQLSDVLIFEDTTGATENNKATIQINAQSYYLDEQTNYLQYDSKYQAIGWIDNATATITYDNADGITKTFRNLGLQGELSIYNNSTSARYITELSIRGNGFFETSTNNTKVGTSGTETTIQTKYIQRESDASTFAKQMGNYYNYSNFLITTTSKTKYEPGSFVEVSDSGIGTIRCRVIKRTWNIRTNTYNYTLESITEYSPIETYTTKQNVLSRNDNGETLRDTVNDLSVRIDNISTNTTMVSADVLSAIIKLDNEGKTITTQDITTTISLKQSEIDLDFSIGQMNLPAGWTYSVNGKQVIFHIAEGVSLRSGQFAIPVIYRAIISEEQYQDENGIAYCDEDGIAYVVQQLSGSYTQWKLYFNYFGDNGGIYLGMFTELSQIPSQNNYGDYFTWGGSNTVSNLSYDGQFLQGRVYKFVGTNRTYQWSQDTDGGHGQIALGDVLGIAGADLRNNNATVYEYLDHLTSNTIYTDMIVANQAYIDSLVANQTFINELSSNTAFIDKLSTNNIFAKNIKSQSGFFEDITVSGVINGATGNMQNINISGDSRFEGTIDSGPLLLSPTTPENVRVINLTAGNVNMASAVEKIREHNGIGYYGNIRFTTAEWSTSDYPYNNNLKLYDGNKLVFNETQVKTSNRVVFTINADFYFDVVFYSGTKTFVLRDLPDYVPTQKGMVYTLGDGVLRIVP